MISEINLSLGDLLLEAQKQTFEHPQRALNDEPYRKSFKFFVTTNIEGELISETGNEFQILGPR